MTTEVLNIFSRDMDNIIKSGLQGKHGGKVPVYNQ